MGTFFKDNLLSYLPAEFAAQDIELGDLADFLEVVAISMDELNDAIEEFPNIIDVDTCDAKFLPYIAKMLNYPLEDRDDVASQRLQLKYAVEWYKRKGLHESFRILFYSLGYVANVVELWTRDYVSFHRYPGSWRPTPKHAKAEGTTTTPITITSRTCNLAISVDGSAPAVISLTQGAGRSLASIASEIDAGLDVVRGDCELVSGVLTITSRAAGAGSSIRIAPVEAAAYGLLELTPKTYYGIDYTVPEDYYELKSKDEPNNPQRNWYKSPHFGIELYSIKNFVFDPEEVAYIRSRLELIRPIHTVLDFLDYIKALSDAFEVTEDDFIAQITPELIEVWPFAICLDRGKLTEFEYIRDGLVPDRSEATRVSYAHKRNAANNVDYRGEFVYEYELQYRDNPTGPTAMPKRDTIRYFRRGQPVGEPMRDSCANDSETLEWTLGFEEEQDWCMELLRDGGAKFRNLPDTYYRDGSFTLLTNRDPRWFNRDGEDVLLDRSGCNKPTDADLGLLFSRPDLPGVYFKSIAALTDPYILGLLDMPLPGPGELGPALP